MLLISGIGFILVAVGFAFIYLDTVVKYAKTGKNKIKEAGPKTKNAMKAAKEAYKDNYKL